MADWMISLTAQTPATNQADAMYWRLCEIAKDFRRKDGVSYVNISSSLVGEEIEAQEVTLTEEYQGDGTLNKVLNALIAADLSEEQANAAITSMQNYGILFRERR